MKSTSRLDYQFIFVLMALMIATGSSKCHNSSDFRYDLKEPSEIVNYNSICFEYSKRTCCSQKNFETVAKKITKFIGMTYDLSHLCRWRLTNLLCSSCDGDIGQNIRQGVCDNYCNQLFQDCKDDYFAFDTNNQLKVCREDDIICSRLSDIVAEKGSKFTCQLLDQRVNQQNCWNGEISARLKGKAKRKVTIPLRKKPKQPQNNEPWISTQLKVYLGLVGLLALVLLYQYWRWYKNSWRRQIRNL